MTDVGPDPIVWIERLLEVNDGAKFTPAQKQIIKDALARTILELTARSGGVLIYKAPYNKGQT